MKGSVRLKQLSSLERAIEYIEAHLDEDISLNDVSRETGYSYYHMTRLFSTALGESVGRYINRRRLYNASEKLIYSDQRIIDIALNSGFKSPEAFSRAFKSVFGNSPADYRKAGLNLVVNAKRELASKDVCHIAGNISHSPEILVMEEIKVAGIRGTTSLTDNQLPRLWQQFLCLQADHTIASEIGYGICETQQSIYTKDGDILFSILVGCAVNSFDDVPDAFEKKILSAGKYAVFTHRGTFANLHTTYQYIFGTWLAAGKEELDAREDFEVYEQQVRSFDDPDNEVKIFIPIR